MEWVKQFQNSFTRLLITAMVVVIVTIYYLSELRPFEYEGYEKNVNQLQRYDAELNESIVLSRFGLLRYYDPIDDSLNGVKEIISNFNHELKINYNAHIQERLNTLIEAVNLKSELVQEFKQINPVMINAVNQFARILAQAIEILANKQLVESAFQQDLQSQYEQDYRKEIMDKINNLFRGTLIYVSFRQEEQKEYLIGLISDLNNAAMDQEKFPNLDTALVYANKIIELQPKLTNIDKQLFEVPIVPALNELNEVYKNTFESYLDRSHAYRIILYALVFVLLVVLRWAFSQLRGMVKALKVEINLKIKAEKELEEINRQLEQRVKDRTKELTVKNKELDKALVDLKETQDQLIIQEKMASVGMLTTGIAHEIKNPLNFVNNFSDISVDLVGELSDELEKHRDKFDPETESYIKEVLEDLKTNCSKIKEHGVRADNIVKTMLLHSQESSVQKEPVDITGLLENNLNIALESFKSTHPNFEPQIEKDYAQVDKVLIAPQAIGRLFIYLIDNALYALNEQQQKSSEPYQPTLSLSIGSTQNSVMIKIKDNGTGIPKKFLDKVFEPFYTTKPTGKGNTGLGLSICYDTVVKQHKGELRVTSEEGNYTEFTVTLAITQES